MSQVWTVKIPHLQAKKKSVMPAQAASSVAAEGQTYKTWIPAFAGKTERKVNFQSTLLESLGFAPKDV
jgi:hypothetical protein